MLDRVCVANEIVSDTKRCHNDYLIFKENFKIAYNSISQEFLYYMMRRLCFCQKWLVWIKGGVEQASISIHDNGSPTEEFKAQRGL